jgi:hypothetical protein
VLIADLLESSFLVIASGGTEHLYGRSSVLIVGAGLKEQQFRRFGRQQST